jgi:hypothetical protein
MLLISFTHTLGHVKWKKDNEADMGVFLSTTIY